MRTVTLVSLGLGGAGVATGAGFAINNYIKEETIKKDEDITENIREHIKKTNKSKNKVFLTSSTPTLADIKAKYTAYEGTRRPKPKDVSAEQLVNWCSDNVDSKFKDENNDTYKNILSWCYINSKTIEEEMTSNGKKLLSTENANHEHWKNAWDKYNEGKDNSVLRIPEAPEGELNKAGAERDKGGQALHAWCTKIKGEGKKLYDGDTEETYEIFEAWCTASAG